VKFSVVTPVRNGMPYISGAIDSCQSQGDIELEHFVQNAYSEDGLLDYLRDKQSVIVNTEHDRGMYDAINIGWSRSSGDVLSWLNADEQYLPGILGVIDAAFKKNPDIDVFFGDVIIVDRYLRPLAYRRENLPRSFVVANTFLYIYSCSLFFRRKLWDDGILKLDTSFKYAADMDLVLRLIESGCRFGSLKIPTSTYMATGRNLSLDRSMEIETSRIRQKYGKFSIGTTFRAKFLRTIDRIECGSFFPRTGSISVWDHVLEHRKSVSYKNLGFRYSIFEEG